jgi:hypothetical protein
MSQAPQDLERSDEQPKSQYVSRRDVRVVAIAVIVLAVLLSPVYFVLKEGSDAFKCKRNIRAISKAISLYAAENNDRLPPAYVTFDGVTPFVEKDGGVYSWAYLVHPHMPKDASLRCPKASDDECFLDHDSGTGALLPVSYGMYLPMSAMPLSSIPNPESAVLVTETASLGASDTFNPHPLKDADGKAVRDGFVITWDSGNTLSEDKVTWITRLAYPGTHERKFEEEGRSRHPGGNHYITVGGSAMLLSPLAAKVDWDSKQRRITGRWSVPESAYFNAER